MTRTAVLVLGLRFAGLACAPPAIATPSRGTRETTLQPRDVDGDGKVDAFFDTVLNITWLRDADQRGLMFLPQARAWADTLSFGGYTNWRLPRLVDTGPSGCDWAYVDTDCGHNVQTVVGSRVFSEMAHLFGVTLGNTPYCDAQATCDQAGWGLTNRGDFTNLRDFYWFGTDYTVPDRFGWYYYTPTIYQAVGVQELAMYAMAVRDRDSPWPADRAAGPSARMPDPARPPSTGAAGTWQQTLLQRDVDGDGQADTFYDTRLGITWLRRVNPAGPMFWPDARDWVATFRFGGYDGWRLPRLVDLLGSGCNFNYRASDCGYNVRTATARRVFSELAHLFTDTLGNISYCGVNRVCDQPGWGLSQTGNFVGMDVGFYWTTVGYEPAPDFQAWYFYAHTMYQSYAYQIHQLNVLPVHDGDIGAPLTSR